MTSRIVTKWLPAVAFTAIAGLMSAGTAHATASLTFDQFVQNGTIDYTTLGGPLVGTAIEFDFVTVAGTAFDGTYGCQSCSLDFTTGNVTGGGPGLYTFGGGGSFVLTGGIGAFGIPTGTILLTGSFTNNPANVVTAAGSTGGFVGYGTDQKNADLAAFLGIDPFLWRYTNTEFSLSQLTINPDGTFSGNVTQADLQNVKAPEPASSLLLLLGIGSLLAYRRKQQ